MTAHNNARQTQEAGQGSFLNGFTIGLFAGAAGLFLFGTKRGDAVRKQVRDEWDQAKEHLAEEGIIPTKDQSFRGTVRGFFDTIGQKIVEFTAPTDGPLPSKVKPTINKMKAAAEKVEKKTETAQKTAQSAVRKTAKKVDETATAAKKRVFKNT